MEERILYFNGSYRKESEAKLSIFDRGFLFGDAAYDIGRTFNHQPFKWKQHIDRLYRSLRFIQIDPGLTPQEMYDITLEVFRRNEKNLGPLDDYAVSHRVSRGVGFSVKEVTAPTVLVYCLPIPFGAIARKYVEGANLIVASTRRTPPECIDPEAKLHNKLNHILAELEARSIDPDAYVLMLDTRGFLAECTSQNIFLVKDGRLLTPKRNYVLEGITRATIMEMAPKLGLPCGEEDLSTYDLSTADEIFVTANSITIMPITRLNGRTLGKPVPGPVTKRLLAAWSEMVGIDIVEQALAHRE